MDAHSLARGAATVLLGFVAACTSPAAGGESHVLGSTSQAIIRGVPSARDSVVQLATGSVTDGIHQQIYQKGCTASLVAKNLVMTARHCVSELATTGTAIVRDYDASLFYVFTGGNAPTHLDDGTAPAARGASLVLPDSKELSPDIAFIVLEQEVTDAPIAAIRLMTPPMKGEPLTLVGFGRTETGEYPNERLERAGLVINGVGPFTGMHQKALDGEFLIGEGACFGDSGGPAFSSTTGAVVGVTSRVYSGKRDTEADPSAPCVGASTEDIFTSVPAMKALVERAFAAAGAAPVVEAPVPFETPEEKAPAAPAAAKTTAAELPPDEGRRPSFATNDGCSASSASGHSTPNGAAIVMCVALGAALLARGRRRD